MSYITKRQQCQLIGIALSVNYPRGTFIPNNSEIQTEKRRHVAEIQPPFFAFCIPEAIRSVEPDAVDRIQCTVHARLQFRHAMLQTTVLVPQQTDGIPCRSLVSSTTIRT